MKMARDIAEATFGRMMSNGGSCYVSGMATFDKEEIESIIAAKLEPVKEALVYAWNAGLIARSALDRFEGS